MYIYSTLPKITTYSQHKKFLFSDPKFLPYFLPQKFGKEKIFPLLVRSIQKDLQIF